MKQKNARLIKCTVAGLPTGAGYAIGCIAMTEAGALYVNTGTAAVASFVVIGTIAANSVVTTAIKNANVTLEKLAAGITPSHIVKFAGTSEAFAGGSTSTAITITGALSTDIATAVIRASANAVSIVKAVLTADTLTVTFFRRSRSWNYNRLFYFKSSCLSFINIVFSGFFYKANQIL